VYQDNIQSKARKRLSPKHCTYNNIFDELIYIPELILNPNLSVEGILIQIEETRQRNGKGNWKRNGWSIRDKKLLKVIGWRTFDNPNDFLTQLPWDIDVPFSNYDLANKLKQALTLTRRMTYCLRKMGVLHVVGKKRNALLFCF